MAEGPIIDSEIYEVMPVPNYTAWLPWHMCVNNLPRVVTWGWNAEGRPCNLSIATPTP